MKGVSTEQIAQAKQIDLLSYLKACEPQNLQAEGPHDYRHKAFHTLIVSDNGKWNWTDHDVGGTTALNYLIKVPGQDFVPSVRQLKAMQWCGDFSFQPVQKSPPPEKRSSICRQTMRMAMRSTDTCAGAAFILV